MLATKPTGYLESLAANADSFQGEPSVFVFTDIGFSGEKQPFESGSNFRRAVLSRMRSNADNRITIHEIGHRDRQQSPGRHLHDPTLVCLEHVVRNVRRLDLFTEIWLFGDRRPP